MTPPRTGQAWVTPPVPAPGDAPGSAARSDAGNAPASADEGQRIDRWLWCARFFKTRALAAKFVSEGRIRLTRSQRGGASAPVRIVKPSALVRAGDTLVFTRRDRLRIIEVSASAVRRGPAGEAATLYADRSPPPPPSPKRDATPAPFAREAGSGRPTKRDRRSLDALRGGE